MNSEAEIPSVTLEDTASHLWAEIKFNKRSTTSSPATWKAANQLNSPCIQKNLGIAPTMGLQKGLVVCGSQKRTEVSDTDCFGLLCDSEPPPPLQLSPLTAPAPLPHQHRSIPRCVI